MNPTPRSVLAVAQDIIDQGYAEQGTNQTKFGAWYGMQGGEWCAMFVSWCLAHGGFSDDGGETTIVPGVAQTSRKGWAYCPYMRDAFAAVGRRFSTPEVGDIFIVNAHTHTGLVAEVSGATFISAEGNYEHRAANVRRSIGSCYYLRPPYSAATETSGIDRRWWFVMGIMRPAA